MLPKQPNQSVIDGIRCLQGVVTSADPVGVSELSRELDLEVTRTHRLLRTLAHIGLVRWTPNRKYAPGPGLPVLAAQTLHASGFYKAIPVVDALHRELDIIVALGMLWGRTVSYLYHASSGVPLAQAIGRLETLPASTSSLGVALLSKRKPADVAELYKGHHVPGFKNGFTGLKKVLAETAKRDYSFIQTDDMNHSMAVVVDENLGMALGVSGKLSEGDIPRLLPLMQECAHNVSEAMKL